MDNDPTDEMAEASNRDSNKGIVNLNGEAYVPLVDAMRELNTRIYPLIEHFDGVRGE